VLADYTPSFLQSTLTLTATGAVTTYCLWAFDQSRSGLGAHPGHDVIWTQLTVVPFALAILHVLRVLDAGRGSAPEELAIKDHWLHLYGAVWLLFFLIGIYG
jgi:decaprenyl-phosphate phosphoribosyltransferase